MRKASLLVSVAVFGGLVGFAALPAFSDAAVHAGEFSCGIPDGNGGLVITTDSAQVSTSGGVTVLKCQADVANDTGSAVQWDAESFGTPCGIFGDGSTDDWHATVSASGKATLTCKINVE